MLVENPAQEVVSGRDDTPADQGTEECKNRDLGPPDAVVRRKGDCGQPVHEEVRELVQDAGKNDVQARRRPDHVSDLFHTPKIAVRIEGRIGQQW